MSQIASLNKKRAGHSPSSSFYRNSDFFSQFGGASTSVVADLEGREIKSDQLQLIGRLLAGPFVLSKLVADLLAFVQITDASAFNCADMDENVLSAIIRLNEAEAFLRIKPFYGAGAHGDVSLYI